MRQETQVELLHRLFHYIDSKSTARVEQVFHNEVTTYTCPRRLAREKALLFRHYPLLMGLSGDVRNPGDFLTHDETGVPMLLVRSSSGTLNAFRNVCRHRGARLVEGRGTTQRDFSCPYHGWCYDLQGRLTAIPDAQSFPGVDRSRHSLISLPVVERHGLIWVQPTPGETFDLDTYLGGMQDDFAHYGFASYHHYRTTTLRRKMNWKIMVDTFLEAYHVGILHRNSVGPIFYSNLVTCDPFGLHLRMVLPRKTITTLRQMPERDWTLIPYTAIVYALLPNTIFVIQGDHVEVWRSYPVGDAVDECVMDVALYTPEPATTEKAIRHWDANWDLLLKTVNGEDFPVSEGMQRGFLSGAQEHLTYGRNEPALIHYHRALRQALAE